MEPLEHVGLEHVPLGLRRSQNSNGTSSRRADVFRTDDFATNIWPDINQKRKPHLMCFLVLGEDYTQHVPDSSL